MVDAFKKNNERDWLCDHLGKACEVMDKMWIKLCKIHPELPLTGFDDNTYSENT